MDSAIILDASVTAAWVLDDENSPYADAVIDRIRSEGATVPQFWHIEMRNVLVIAEHRRRINADVADGHLIRLQSLPIRVDQGLDLPTAYSLARTHNLTFYDAIYLEATLRNDGALATLDRALTRAANAEGLFLVV
ncbi:MAG: type II toxin-antitoxin system VapC family toxin [Chloroflexi bacterium]|nr:type II toxin-antitoxin system VapC family toxin [Chloroflexota bacterium]